MTAASLLHDTEARLPALRASFADATREPERFAIRFYERLFELAPSLRPLFPVEMKTQRQKLLQALTMMLRSLDKPEIVLPALRQLGVRHAGYGVQVRHYAIVGQVLVDTLAERASEPLDSSLRIAWATLYGWVAATMLEGAGMARAADGATEAAA